MKINMIAAVGKNLELGKDNKLIWHLKEDLKYFKEMTTDKTVVMGENTFYSIGKALPNRKNIVLSFDKKDIPGVIVINDYKKVFDIEEEIFIIGGASIYKLFLPFADTLYLTEIDKEEEKADCYFPNFDKNKYKKEIIKTSEDKGIKYSFVCYKKRRNI